MVKKETKAQAGVNFTMESDEKVCMFCLETKRGRRRLHYPIEFKKLFVCDCVFQSHAECIIKWQIHCLDEIQCPICRVHIIVPPQIRAQEIQREEGITIKKTVYFVIIYCLAACVLFTIFSMRV